MTLQDQLDALLDATAFDSTGNKIGNVRQVYVDNKTGKATFAAVSTGVFSADAIVPLHGARILDNEIHVDHSRQSIKNSPRLNSTEDALTPDQEADLLEHYGLEAPWVRATPAEKSANTNTSSEPSSAKDVAETTDTRSSSAPEANADRQAADKSNKKDDVAADDKSALAGRTAQVPPKNSPANPAATPAAPPETPAPTGTTATPPARKRTGSSRIDIAALKSAPARPAALKNAPTPKS